MKQAEDPPANRCGATGCGGSHWAYRGNLWDISGRDETFSLTLMRIPDDAPFGERRIVSIYGVGREGLKMTGVWVNE
jgi:hypothetical protein